MKIQILIRSSMNAHYTERKSKFFFRIKVDDGEVMKGRESFDSLDSTELCLTALLRALQMVNERDVNKDTTLIIHCSNREVIWILENYKYLRNIAETICASYLFLLNKINLLLDTYTNIDFKNFNNYELERGNFRFTRGVCKVKENYKKFKNKKHEFYQVLNNRNKKRNIILRDMREYFKNEDIKFYDFIFIQCKVFFNNIINKYNFAGIRIINNKINFKYDIYRDISQQKSIFLGLLLMLKNIKQKGNRELKIFHHSIYLEKITNILESTDESEDYKLKYPNLMKELRDLTKNLNYKFIYIKNYSEKYSDYGISGLNIAMKLARYQE